MGVWGVEIFDDDFAVDLKEEYSEIIESGISHEVATLTLKERYKEELQDADDAGIFWLALAATQLEHDAVLNDVRTNALEIIRSNRDLLRWEENPDLLNSRKQILEQLKNQLIKN